MDIYHKVLVKLYEVTGGKDSQTVDIKDLVKKLGFHGNYPSIFERLSVEGWIAEDRADFARITHWGIAEAKKVQKSGDTSEKPADKSFVAENADKCAQAAREFVILMENFAKDASKETLEKAAKKFAEMETVFNIVKTDAR